MFSIINDFFFLGSKDITILGDPRAVSRVGKGRGRKFAKETPGIRLSPNYFQKFSRWRLLIGHKKCFVSLCPIGEQFILPQKIFNFLHSRTLFSALVMRYGSKNGKQLQVTIIKITESKENKSIHRLAVSGSTGPVCVCVGGGGEGGGCTYSYT